MTAPYAPPRRTWRTRLREIVTERLGLKAIALLLAVLLWLVVHARRPATRGYVEVQPAPLPDSSRRTPMVSEGRTAEPAPASDSTATPAP